jgi:hypothetical protein
MSDVSKQIESVVSPYARTTAQKLRQEAAAAGHRDKGTLIRGMNGRVRKDGGGDVWGISVSMKRSGYILHHGVKPQTVQRGGFSYYTGGFPGSGFISKALNQVTPKLADDLARLSGDLTVKAMNF